MITLADAFLLEFEFIALLHCLATGFLIGRLVLAKLLHLLIDDALLALHLAIEGEELSSLVGSKASLLSDELLKIGLELLWRELLLLFSTG